MAKYKPYSYDQGVFLPVHFEKQVMIGTFEYSLNHLIDSELDVSFFDERYKNDVTGARAYDPRILLKIILFAYSKGITSSRQIARCCEENVIFMALSANTRPHFTTIADFIATMGDKTIALFREIILVCDEMGLIGREMFAVDGCKLPSNASKEWSGTKADFKKKCIKLEKAIERMVKRHRQIDSHDEKEKVAQSQEQYIKTLRRQIKKIRNWTDDNDDKPGSGGKAIKSNITDNDSAKMKTSKGVIQGYNGVAMVDSKHQVIVAAEAYGKAQEHDLLEPMIDNAKENFSRINREDNVFEQAQLTADSGFHTNKNMQMLIHQGIDGYVADRYFRKRDPRFDNCGRYKERAQKERQKRIKKTDLFFSKDFTVDPDLRFCICPAGKQMYQHGNKIAIKGHIATRFKGTKGACLPCELRHRCLRKPDKTEVRQVAYFHGRTNTALLSATEKMKRKIDSPIGRLIYSKRIGTVEPVFANIRHTLGLDRFSHRGKVKVGVQWLLFCAVHNLKKLHRFGLAPAT